jgi:hypothetical protein
LFFIYENDFVEGGHLGENFVMEAIGAQQIKIMPDILIGGGGDATNGPISGLLGLQLLEQVRKNAANGNGAHGTAGSIENK